MVRTVIAGALAAGVLAGCGGEERKPRDGRAAGVCPSVDFADGRALECPVAGGRRYFLVAPPGGAESPLVVVLHGSGGPQATPEDTALASGFDVLARSEGFAVAFPDGEGSWDEREDVGFLRAVVEDVARRRPVDPARVFVAGWSGGGFMVHRAGCELAAQVAAIAVLQAPLRASCEPAKPVSVLQVTGGQDPFIPVSGGGTPDGTRSPAVAAAMRRWARADRCQGQRRKGSVRTWTRCDGGASVAWINLPDAGHDWYGEADGLDATAAAWQFFSENPRAE